MIRHHSRLAWAGGGAAVLLALGVLPARADEKGEALLKEVEKANKAAKTLTADLTMSYNAKDAEGKGQAMKLAAAVKLKKPNLARIEFSEGQFARVIASDGKNLYTLMPNNQYQKNAADAQGRNISALWATQISMFFSGQFTGFGGDKPTPMYVGRQTVDGTDYEVVQTSSAKPFIYTAKLYIAPSKLVTRMEMQITQDKQKIAYDAVLKNVKVDATLSDSVFAYAPPKGATLYKAPSMDDYNNKLLPVNSAAPKFALSTPTGGKVALDDVLKSKKAVLVNFWFYG